MTEKIRLLIVDDHKMIREGLKAFLVPNPDLEIVAEARNGLEAVELARRLSPDVVVMDLVMPELDGIEATRRIVEQNPQSRILMLTSFAEDERVLAAIHAGAAGYLLKDSSPQELEEAIRVVHAGDSYLPPNIMRKLIRNLKNKPEEQAAPDGLTPRETQILKLVAEGKSNDEIAGQLFLSVQTVRSHLWRLMKKLQVDNRTQAALYAVKTGIVSKKT